MSLIIDTIRAYLPAKKKQTPSGWISFNAPCCGDQRQRGGLIFNSGDAVSYHCFNCDFKTSWQPGRLLSHKMRQFMQMLNMSDDIISKLSFDALRLHETDAVQQIINIIPVFHDRTLPIDAEPLLNVNKVSDKMLSVLQYIGDRGLYLEDYPFYWSPTPGLNNRLIIPFFYENRIVGYTCRKVTDNGHPKYISEQQPRYVFNLDRQTDDRLCVIVCEGPFDAISIDGCALLGSEIKESQDWLLKRLQKEIILVPDRDHKGMKTVEKAIDYGWSVSMPEWPEGIKDINDAVIKFGRVATLWMILQAKESYHLKITLKAKSWFRSYI